MSKVELILGDCLNKMSIIRDKSVDLILCDLPFGRTRNKWDCVIPFEPLWAHYKRIIKDNGAILLFSQVPFNIVLGASNLEMLRYEWIWKKTTSTGFLNANKMPLKAHENILVFYKKLPIYNPQKEKNDSPVHNYTKHTSDGTNYGKTVSVSGGGSYYRFPKDILTFKSDKQKEAFHPTQKPVALLEYLIKTYTNENEVVLDNCMGSGSTGVACINTNRNFIGIELDKRYYDIAVERCNKAKEIKNEQSNI